MHFASTNLTNGYIEPEKTSGTKSNHSYDTNTAEVPASSAILRDRNVTA